MADVQQLRRAMEHIEAHPEQHNQDAWHCGTKQCIGGWTCTLNGYRFAAEYSDYESFLVINPVTSEYETAEDAAQRLLDLTDDEAYRLFYVCDTLDEVRGYVNALIARYHISPVSV